MKIAILVFGAIDYSVVLAKALSKYCDVQFFCSKCSVGKKDNSILNVLDDRVGMHIYDDYRIRDFRNILSYYRLAKEIGDSGFDVIHIQAEPYPWFLVYRKMWRGIPVICTVHDIFQHPGLGFWISLYQDIMQRISIRFSDRIIVHGDILKKRFLDRFPGRNPEDVIILPHGDFSIYRYWDRKNGINTGETTRNILFFGNITPYKGLEYLLRAEPIIRERISNYRIVIAGEGFTSTYRKWVSDYSKFKIVNKFIPNEDVSKYFSDASVVVLPYTSASQSGIIPIAYAFGKPVIATKVGAIPEVINEGKTGILVPPKDEQSLANAIVELLSDKTLLRNMGENAAEYCERHFSWDPIAKKTVAIYYELMQGSKHKTE